MAWLFKLQLFDIMKDKIVFLLIFFLFFSSFVILVRLGFGNFFGLRMIHPVYRLDSSGFNWPYYAGHVN